jgi:ribose transport system permease protein
MSQSLSIQSFPLKKFQSLLALLLLCVVLSFMTDKFFTADNGLNVLRQVAVNVCIATGMTLVVLTAGIDLSVGSVLALCGALTAGLFKNGLSFPANDLFVGFTILGAIVGVHCWAGSMDLPLPVLMYRLL